MADSILITGMSGRIGGVARARFEGKASLRALNRRAVDGVETVRADLADYEAIRPAFDGIDTVIHLAATVGNRSSWEELRDTNITGTRNVFEAAKDAGCRRVVFASSGATVSGWEREDPYAAMIQGRYEDVPESWTMITHEMATRPNGAYASTKVWGEALARQYVDTSELSVLCVRIGVVNAEDRPTSPRAYSVWCSHRDVGNMIELCVAAPRTLIYDILFANSSNRWGYRDLSHSKDAVGFEPQDAAEDHRP